MGRIDFGEKRPQKKNFTAMIIKKSININDININETLISKWLFPEIIKLIIKLNMLLDINIITTSNHYI